jgi:hypothetical protein
MIITVILDLGWPVQEVAHSQRATFEREKPMGTGQTRLDNPSVMDQSTGDSSSIMREAGGLWKKTLSPAC